MRENQKRGMTFNLFTFLSAFITNFLLTWRGAPLYFPVVDPLGRYQHSLLRRKLRRQQEKSCRLHELET